LAALGDATQKDCFISCGATQGDQGKNCHIVQGDCHVLLLLRVSLRNVTNVNDPLGNKKALALATLGSTTRNRNNPICFMLP
jgi:hypothetical protein